MDGDPLEALVPPTAMWGKGLSTPGFDAARGVGITSYLIGESLMRADDVETATHALISEARP